MPEKNDTKWHKDQVKEFREVQSVFKIYADVLEAILKKAGNLYAPLFIVQARAKTIPSFAEKAIRKANKYNEPVKQITDLCGARIITHFQYQADRICEFIKKHFEIDEANSLDVSSRLSESEFGYRSIHYIVMPKKEKILGITIPKEIKDKKAEIQVRTLLQHTWADISHDRIYKTPITVPKKWKREIFRLAAILEKVDNAFGELSTTIDYYTENYSTMMSEDNLKQEIIFMETILANERNVTNKPGHALRLAKLFQATGDWEKVVEVLESYIQIDDQQKLDILILHGYALCQINKKQTDSLIYQKGLDELYTVAAPDDPIQKDDRFTAINLMEPKSIKRRAHALYFLGCSLGRIRKEKQRARDLFYMAYQLEPSNPYYFAAYAEFEIYCSTQKNTINLLRPSILEILQTCKEHIYVGIEQARAYFTMGRLLLVLGETDNGVGAYAKAVDLCISQKTCLPQDVFDEELDALIRLNGGNKTLPREFRWLRDLILLAKIVKYQDENAKHLLKSRAKRKKNFISPVTVIAGGAENMPKIHMPEYASYLTRALQSYEGTVIAGGTTSGIPGLVGLATQAARENKNGHFTLIGYLPKKLPSNAKVNKHYDELIETDENLFSVEELIQYWIDLILNAINPSDVLMLGINGGRISDIAYRLALALGATVGLVESSGRAASGLMLDEDWIDHERIIKVPQDALSVWAFVNQFNPPQLSREQIEEAAKKVHQYYLKKKIEDKNTTDKSMLPWEKLDEGLKESNRKQVSFMENVLKDVGYGIRAVADPKIYKLDEKIIIRMAEMEHARWNIERLNSGWKYGPNKDIEKKTSPFLIPWNSLPEDVKSWDICAVQKFPEILAEAGFEIFPIKK